MGENAANHRLNMATTNHGELENRHERIEIRKVRTAPTLIKTCLWTIIEQTILVDSLPRRVPRPHEVIKEERTMKMAANESWCF